MNAIGVEIRADNKRVAAWLLEKNERKAGIEVRREEILKSPSLGIPKIPSRGVKVSDPTGFAALKLTELMEAERWIAVIEEVERRLPDKQRIFLELRREAGHLRGDIRGRPAWVPYVQCKYPLVMAERTGKKVAEFYISHPNTYTTWWNRIIEYTARIAAKRGLLG
jgi:hypothetical protein